MVRELYSWLVKLTKKQFREGYSKIDETYPDELSGEDLEYSWEYLQDSIPFFRLAAEKDLWVLFTADQ